MVTIEKNITIQKDLFDVDDFGMGIRLTNGETIDCSSVAFARNILRRFAF